jgi:hypothetical protein
MVPRQAARTQHLLKLGPALSADASAQQLFLRNIHIHALNPLSEELVEASVTQFDYADGHLHQATQRDRMDSQLENVSRQTYTYADNRIAGEISEQWEEGTGWVNDHTTIYTYINNRLSQIVYRAWQAERWEDSTRTSYTYQNDGDISAFEEELWDGAAWIPYEQTLLDEVDDGQGGINTEIVLQEWDGAAWINTEKTIYVGWSITQLMQAVIQQVLTADAMMEQRLLYQFYRFISNMVEQEWDGEAWVNVDRVTVESYHLFTGWPTAVLTDEWDAAEDAWQPTGRMVFTYQGHITVTTLQRFEDQEWVPADQLDDATEGAYVPAMVWDYSYDGPATALSQIDMSFVDETGEPLFLLSRIVFDWEDTQAGVEPEMPVDFTLDANYPNPFNPTTRIQFMLPGAGAASLRVYDLLGREVATLFDGVRPGGPQEVTFEAGTLPSGTYLYRLEAAGYQLTRRMTLLK